MEYTGSTPLGEMAFSELVTAIEGGSLDPFGKGSPWVYMGPESDVSPERSEKDRTLIYQRCLDDLGSAYVRAYKSAMDRKSDVLVLEIGPDNVNKGVRSRVLAELGVTTGSSNNIATFRFGVLPEQDSGGADPSPVATMDFGFRRIGMQRCVGMYKAGVGAVDPRGGFGSPYYVVAGEFNPRRSLSHPKQFRVSRESGDLPGELLIDAKFIMGCSEEISTNYAQVTLQVSSGDNVERRLRIDRSMTFVELLKFFADRANAIADSVSPPPPSPLSQ